MRKILNFWLLLCSSLCISPGISLQLPPKYRLDIRLRAVVDAGEDDDYLPTRNQKKPPLIRLEDVNHRFSRSSGAGGQNVNKLETKVEIRLDLKKFGLSSKIIDYLKRNEPSRIIVRDERYILRVSSSRFRTQNKNLNDALQKIQSIVNGAAKGVAPPPAPTIEKMKKIRRLSNREKRERLQAKKRHSQKKQDRKKGHFDY